jgi:membrane peptidoglycan carboxypeptidase
MGYTPNLVAGVWAGNADNSPMWNIVSTSISWRALRDFMEVALEGEPALTFEQPSGVVKATVCFPSGKLPTEYCGKTVDDLFVADSLPKEKDDWWQPIKIDTRNGLLATEMTPPQFVEERVFLVLPESLTGFSREQAEEWARALGVALAPTERSDPNNLPVVITTPAWGSIVSGVVTVSGRAASSDFESYRLEYGAGASPAAWTAILESTTPVSDDVLGSWDTRSLTAGTYTLRLVVRDRGRGELSTITTVTISRRETPKPVPTPRPQPTSTPTPRPPRGTTR